MLTTLPITLLVFTATQPADDGETLVEVVRALAGQQLFQTYQNLDNATELHFFGLREPRELTRMLRNAIDSAAEADRHLARITKLKGLTADDVAAIERSRKIAKLLVDQGNSLRTYWETGVREHWTDSEVSRKAAYKELVDLLDLEGTKGIAPKPREVGK
jgi:formate-dependent nitrite reductase cytochrome c552 subunit